MKRAMPLRYALTLLLLLAGKPLLAQNSPQLQSSPGGLLDQRPALLSNNPVNAVLPAAQAFALQLLPQADSGLLLLWQIEPGYYLYRKSLQISDAEGRALALDLPKGQQIEDEFFGAAEVYYDALELRLALPADATGTTLLLEYQGCAEDRYCYPPQQQALTLP